MREALLDHRLSRRRAARAQLGQGDCAGCLPVEHDHVLEGRAALAHLVDLGDLCGVLAEHRAHLGMGEDVLALLGRVGLVDRDDGRPGAQRAEVGQRPLRAGAREDRDVVAALDPELGEPAGDLAGRASELGVGDRLPPRGGEGVALAPPGGEQCDARDGAGARGLSGRGTDVVGVDGHDAPPGAVGWMGCAAVGHQLRRPSRCTAARNWRTLMRSLNTSSNTS